MAFKRLTSGSDDAIARMRREVEVGTSLVHENVMPIYDAGGDGTWFTMPFALQSLEGAREQCARDDRALVAVVESVCRALQLAHERGYIHRDIKPSNILSIGERWVVSDWGLVRRPRGETTSASRTRIGQAYGTEGFAAPELSVDAHAAGTSADIYSIGQMIGWVITGELPLANVPRLPPSGPWRTIVRAATRFEPIDRPQSADGFVELMHGELAEPPPPDGISKAIQLLERAKAHGDSAARDELINLALREPSSYELYIDVLPKLSQADVAAAVSTNQVDVGQLVAAYRSHLEGDWGTRNFDWANDVIRFIFYFAATASAGAHWALLEASVEVLLKWDAAWDRWGAQRSIRPWLASLRGEAARIVAGALRQHPDAAAHFSEVADERGADPRIVAALKSTTGA